MKTDSRPLIKAVKRHLRRHRQPFHSVGDGRALRTALRGTERTWNVLVYVQGDTLILAVERFMRLNPEHRGVVLGHLLDLNFRWLLTRAGVDACDGEVRLELTLPWMGGKIKQKEVERAMTVLLMAAENHYGELSALNSTGRSPGEDGEDPEDSWLRRHPREE